MSAGPARLLETRWDPRPVAPVRSGIGLARAASLSAFACRLALGPRASSAAGVASSARGAGPLPVAAPRAARRGPLAPCPAARALFWRAPSGAGSLRAGPEHARPADLGGFSVPQRGGDLWRFAAVAVMLLPRRSARMRQGTGPLRFAALFETNPARVSATGCLARATVAGAAPARPRQRRAGAPGRCCNPAARPRTALSRSHRSDGASPSHAARPRRTREPLRCAGSMLVSGRPGPSRSRRHRLAPPSSAAVGRCRSVPRKGSDLPPLGDPARDVPARPRFAGVLRASPRPRPSRARPGCALLAGARASSRRTRWPVEPRWPASVLPHLAGRFGEVP